MGLLKDVQALKELEKVTADGIGALKDFFRLLSQREFGIAFGLLAQAEKTGLFGRVLIDRLLDRLIKAQSAI
jgi:lipoprotein signal peptidase